CDLRIDLSRKILAAPLLCLQSLGAPRLLAALTEDVATLAAAVQALPWLCVSGAVVFGCLIYMGLLSWPLLLLVAVTIVLGVVLFLLVKSKALGSLQSARQSQDEIFSHFRGLIEGIKELKLNRARREAFFSDDLETSATACRDHSIAGQGRYILAGNIANSLLFITVGVILFGLPAESIFSSSVITGFVLALVYLMAPLAGLVETLPVLSRARVARDSIHALTTTLTASSHPPAWRPGPLLFPGTLDLIGVTHTYRREGDDRPFTLGPIDLTLYPEEVTFLVGGNGSGKTTLALLLVGLYAPETGVIRLGGRVVNEANREQYRQHFTAVFSDFYLFDSLLGFQDKELDGEVRKYLAQLQLDHKVRVEKGAFSTLSLSQGQRKRLALLVAYLEDRPFYVFDEWAADQDPVFKKIFYTEILSSLKARGKTVVVITHDDSYFHVADRCLKLEDGKLAEMPVAAWKPGKPTGKFMDDERTAFDTKIPV
ncbi:MAG: cyclic peptide export ABC transporter, partial [Methylococcales bacterium]